MKVDINCDMGESFGLYEFGYDEEMMKYITSANIACGYHAGDPHVMRKTVQLAKEYNVQIGAHPSFPDLLGFGRRELSCTEEEIKDYITYQVGALREFAKLSGLEIQHCKPHGALYVMAMEDEKLAKAILEAIAEIDKNIIIFALNNSAVTHLGEKMGMRIAKETFADREHTKSGGIVPLRKGQRIDDYTALANRVVRMVKDETVKADTGEDTRIKAQTICIHGDTPGASTLAKHIDTALKNNNIEVTPIKNII
ncbi:LamB/YcsF family protein [Sporosarcina psychrophila]|uniref:LamB/YcsF family protein n=1 Tax=Sporosarcina psychrophila TaxID=1476 RepID=UPI00078D8B72|nr:5-oxoprolinase subunit PxpA [Sporosarcina psychrophila]AMQ07842.1 lactam utilization protein LamB [Sporosarcina psychrophila]